MLKNVREAKFVGLPAQLLPAEMHCLPRNPAFHITIAHYDYHIVVTKTTLIRAQSKALESKETAEKSAYTSLFNFKLYDHIIVFSEMTILFSAQDG